MYNPESVLENETPQMILDFEIPTTRPYHSQKKKKKNLPNGGLCRFGWQEGKTERKQKER